MQPNNSAQTDLGSRQNVSTGYEPISESTSNPSDDSSFVHYPSTTVPETPDVLYSGVDTQKVAEQYADGTINPTECGQTDKVWFAKTYDMASQHAKDAVLKISPPSCADIRPASGAGKHGYNADSYHASWISDVEVVDNDTEFTRSFDPSEDLGRLDEDFVDIVKRH